jgi:hypothetical protein
MGYIHPKRIGSVSICTHTSALFIFILKLVPDKPFPFTFIIRVPQLCKLLSVRTEFLLLTLDFFPLLQNEERVVFKLKTVLNVRISIRRSILMDIFFFLFHGWEKRLNSVHGFMNFDLYLIISFLFLRKIGWKGP